MATIEEEIEEINFVLEDLKEKRQNIEKAEKFAQGRINDFMKNRLNINDQWNVGLLIKKIWALKK